MTSSWDPVLTAIEKHAKDGNVSIHQMTLFLPAIRTVCIGRTVGMPTKLVAALGTRFMECLPILEHSVHDKERGISWYDQQVQVGDFIKVGSILLS